jgi:ribose 1,5-bisphosphate isomerase
MTNEAVKTIAEDRTHGASELARHCLALLAEHAQSSTATHHTDLITELNSLAEAFRQARPSMAPIQNLVGCWQSRLSHFTEQEIGTLRDTMIAYAHELRDRSQQAVTTIARHVQAFIGAHATVMTHSLSSTVVASFKVLRNHQMRAIVTESRPLQEGCQLAQQLSAWKIPVTLITDAQMGLFAGQADAILVGADTLFGDGSVLNKTGTYLLALAARRQNTPFYVASETFKRVSTSPLQAPVEEQGAEELGLPALSGVTVRNLYFDVTPPDLIGAYITEQGVYRQAAQLPCFAP